MAEGAGGGLKSYLFILVMHMFVVLMSVRHLLFLVVVGVTLPLAFCQKGGGDHLPSSDESSHSFFLRIGHYLFILVA